MGVFDDEPIGEGLGGKSYRRKHRERVRKVLGEKFNGGFTPDPILFEKCQHIDGEPTMNDACKCGEDTISRTSSYCEKHTTGKHEKDAKEDGKRLCDEI